jgi:hypothetical protein
VLNGRFDEDFPVKPVLEPMFKLFSEPKELELYDGPHSPPMEVLVPSMSGPCSVDGRSYTVTAS